jgi:hypothetical protein
MKRYLFSIFCCAMLGLEAKQFEHKITITPTQTTTADQKKEYLAEVGVTRIPGGETLTLKFTCVEGKKGEAQIESPDKTDFLAVTVLVPENNPQNEAETSICYTQDRAIILSAEEKVKINTQITVRSWADRRQEILQSIK